MNAGTIVQCDQDQTRKPGNRWDSARGFVWQRLQRRHLRPPCKRTERTKQRSANWLEVGGSSSPKTMLWKPPKAQNISLSPTRPEVAFHQIDLYCSDYFANSVLHLCGRFHDLSLHHWHYVCHVSTKFFHRRFSDGRAVKISQRLQLFSCEIFYHRVCHRFG